VQPPRSQPRAMSQLGLSAEAKEAARTDSEVDGRKAAFDYYKKTWSIQYTDVISLPQQEAMFEQWTKLGPDERGGLGKGGFPPGSPFLDTWAPPAPGGARKISFVS
ncbi:unnamed protein product, partial [Prorocentrum cordatum]